MRSFMPAEWEKQDAIQITWPSVNTDWKDQIITVERCFIEISKVVSRFQKLIIVHHKDFHPSVHFNNDELQNIYFVESEYDDTWARDYAPISVVENGKSILKDFIFNGWGNKFDAQLDNQLNSKLYNINLYKSLSTIDFILEGGSIESNGAGIILTTKQCLFNKNRNFNLSQQEIEAQIKKELFAEKILWLNSGNLIGDDTDAHIDTLARFVDKNSIVYVQCNDVKNKNFAELQLMETELKTFRNLSNQPFNLIPIPAVSNNQYPATYANFLITNNQVLVPLYNCKEDEVALEIFKTIFPTKIIEGVDCSEIIKQNGSLHCLTMQLHAETINLNLWNRE